MLTVLSALLLTTSGPMFTENPKTDENQAVIEQFHRYNKHCKDVLILMTYSDGEFKPLIQNITVANGYSDQERINLQSHCLIFIAGASMNFEDR